MTSYITVIIDGDDSERTAKLRFFSTEYNAGLYETDDGREFYVDPEYIRECQESSKPVHIPLAVITQRQEMLKKLEGAQAELYRLSKEQSTGLVLPDGYS